jgi:hypothetical protein
MEGSLEPPLRMTFLGAGQGVWLALDLDVSAGVSVGFLGSVAAPVFGSGAAGTQLEEAFFL